MWIKTPNGSLINVDNMQRLSMCPVGISNTKTAVSVDCDTVAIFDSKEKAQAYFDKFAKKFCYSENWVKTPNGDLINLEKTLALHVFEKEGRWDKATVSADSTTVAAFDYDAEAYAYLDKLAEKLGAEVIDIGNNN